MRERGTKGKKEEKCEKQGEKERRRKKGEGREKERWKSPPTHMGAPLSFIVFQSCSKFARVERSSLPRQSVSCDAEKV